MSLWNEFKAFAFKGNVIDLAVAVVIGAAFTNVITSLVKYVIMPILSYITPNQSYTDWTIGKVLIGVFLGDVVNFIILAAAVFIVIVKAVGMLMKQAEKPQPAAPPVLTKDQELLAEIRDELRSSRSANRG
jgi:large conductance mechanosensitive channel